MKPPSNSYSSLKDAPVLITGGATGIGAALVDGFCAQGSRVAFIDINDEGAKELCASLPDAKHPPHYFHCDLTDIAATRRAVEEAAERLGGLQVLVNNAARDDRHDPETITAKEWRDSLAVNLDPVMFATQAAMPHLIASGNGSVVNFSSISFMLNMANLPAYGTAKAAIIGLTKTFAGRFGPDNVRVNAVLPGMIVTERQKKLWLTDEGVRKFVEKQCLKRVFTAEDLVDPCLFLASTASGAITAQSIIVDGGVF